MNHFLNGHQIHVSENINGSELKLWINKQKGLYSKDYYLIWNGKLIDDQTIIENGTVHIVLRIVGGKGGFGSMLRAIGAQIEKTTNREACRDLSGRRLRDINEEKRLKNWINQQAEREKEAKERKQKKLERLCEQSKHEFKDEQYDKERSALPEIVENAVIQGLQASCSSKRKSTDTKEVAKKKKAKLWVDEDFDSDISSDENDDDEDDDETSKVKANTHLGGKIYSDDSESSNSSKVQETNSAGTSHQKNDKESSLKLGNKVSLDNSESIESRKIQETDSTKETESQQEDSKEISSEIENK